MSDRIISNRLLASLPPKERERFYSLSEPFPLNYSESLFRPDDKIEFVYFPETGIISLLATVGKETSFEVGIVGREGMVGLPVFLGSGVSRNLAMVQGSGLAKRIPSAKFLKECDRSEALSRVIRSYANSRISQISQSAACFRYHPAEQRLARWLLMTADRMGDETFELTQEFLAHMLGVRREAVTRSARELQKLELIRYSRGRIQILNRELLQRASCECYEIIKSEEIS